MFETLTFNSKLDKNGKKEQTYSSERRKRCKLKKGGILSDLKKKMFRK